ncbi:helix-turn-helix domain-containing protein [Paenibacillus hemerocallicola]|uniref:Helix-turn-helix domain-containing protein n=1 Tax=Paenibacillus hemerocallicola TaxID=1172614 RepID=A0A5C4TFN6_9BACL|nr:helix-turn-helix domain-containing protein [Paenibacillus hemerocallicola]TNJ67239.1 helix-turn-helix domain-containing protein [Paenibacillus hemerocallicola]
MIRFKFDSRRRGWIIFAYILSVCIVSTAVLSYFILNDNWKEEANRANMSLLREVDSKIAFVLQAIDKETIPESYIYEAIRNAVDLESGDLYIVNAEGVIVSHRDKRMINRTADSDPVLSRLSFDRKEGIVVGAPDGAGRTIFYYTSPHTRWKIVSVVPKLLSHEGMLQVRNTLLGICIVLLAFVALAAGRRTSRRVNGLVRNVYDLLKVNRSYPSNEVVNAGLTQTEETGTKMAADGDRAFRQMTELESALKWRLAIQLLTGIGKRADSDTLLSLASLGCKLHTSSFVVICIELDRKEGASPEHKHPFCCDLSNAAEEMIDIGNRGISVQIEQGLTAAIISFEDPGESNLPRAYAVSELIKHYAENDLKRSVTIGIGRVVESAEHIRLSYRQAEAALKYKITLGCSSIIYFGDADERDDSISETEHFMFGLNDDAVGRVGEKRYYRERHEVVDSMLAFIRQHYGRSDLSLNLLADQFKQSVYHLSRIFKEQTGGNFIDYVLRLRVEKAKELLLASDKKVRDVAEEVGYRNLNSFVRIFKKTTGFTPTEFRDQGTEQPEKPAKSAK